MNAEFENILFPFPEEEQRSQRTPLILKAERLTETSFLGDVAQMLLDGARIALPTDIGYVIASHAFRECSPGGPASTREILLSRSAYVTRWTELPDGAKPLIKAHWPGPLTLELPPHADTPRDWISGTGAVHVRHAFSEVLNRFIEALGGAMWAQVLGPEMKTVHDVYQVFGEELALYIDDETVSPMEATRVRFSWDHRPVIMKEGAVSKISILSLLPT